MANDFTYHYKFVLSIQNMSLELSNKLPTIAKKVQFYHKNKFVERIKSITLTLLRICNNNVHSFIQSFNKQLTFAAWIQCAGNHVKQSTYICSSQPEDCVRNGDVPGTMPEVTAGERQSLTRLKFI